MEDKENVLFSERVFKGILSFLNARELCRCSMVCKRWRKLSELNQFWKRIFKLAWPMQLRALSAACQGCGWKWKQAYAKQYLCYSKENKENGVIVADRKRRTDDSRKPLKLIQ